MNKISAEAQEGFKQKDYADKEKINTFHINQRDEIIDLKGISGALLTAGNMQMQTFIAKEATLCLNDHGGDRMDITENITPTLRAGMCGHPPLVAAVHKDNEETCKTICIAGNIINREQQNGGNGLGCQSDISYTITASDRHAVFNSKNFSVHDENEENIKNQCTDKNKQTDENRKLIRRLTPLECERLQGFPDGWTLIPKASDSARYKALGNSVAIPCVSYIMKGIACVLRNEKS